MAKDLNELFKYKLGQEVYCDRFSYFIEKYLDCSFCEGKKKVAVGNKKKNCPKCKGNGKFLITDSGVISGIGKVIGCSYSRKGVGREERIAVEYQIKYKLGKMERYSKDWIYEECLKEKKNK